MAYGFFILERDADKPAGHELFFSVPDHTGSPVQIDVIVTSKHHQSEKNIKIYPFLLSSAMVQTKEAKPVQALALNSTVAKLHDL
eukprot:scaffold11089_cov69-Skeletonema_marinoi.AAC.2